LVGGKVEAGETVIEGLHREITEEVGNNFSYSKIIPIEQFTSDNGKFVFHTFLIPIKEEFVPKLNHEHRGYCWVPLKDHPRPLHPGVWRSFKFAAIVDKLTTMESVFKDQPLE
jgi:8-oxo-dGTP pyrophosphatase MutT (NUDIX family)